VGGLIGGAEATADTSASDAPWSDVNGDDPDADLAVGDLLDLVVTALREHVQLEEDEYLAVALWAMHTHAFDQYRVTPRLVLVSPVRGCGKTTLLDMLGALCRHGRRFDGVTAAALFRLIETMRPTLLLDEIDTHSLASGNLRGVLNSGHRRGGCSVRAGRSGSGQHEVHEFATFSPVALATIGLDALPLPLQQCSVVIQMRRANGERQLRRPDDATKRGQNDRGLRAARRHNAMKSVTCWADNLCPDCLAPPG
jgi:hypothetical protein